MAKLNTFRLASFGMRGFVGESLNPEQVINFAASFGSFAEAGTVLVGRDTRISSPMLHSATVSALLATGCLVLDLGICPTGMIQYLVGVHSAAGAVSISGGHNAMGWNALTLIGRDGAYLDPSSGDVVLDHFHSRQFLLRDWRSTGSVQALDNYAEGYFQALESRLDADRIRSAGFKVLVDPLGGAGCDYLPEFARRFGLDLITLNGAKSGYLAREAEPRPRSAKQMAEIIRHVGGQVGFVFSSDMARLSLVSEGGEPLSEEYTFALIADHVLEQRPGPLVANTCTSRMLDDIAQARGVPLVKVPVGQAPIVAGIQDENAVLGGEGSGSVAWPAFSPAYDGFAMMGLVLEALALRACPLSSLIRSLPRYHIVKRSVEEPSVEPFRLLDYLRHGIDPEGKARIDLGDGIRADWPDGWVHVRPSRTQRLVRVLSESASREKAVERAEYITALAMEYT